MMIHTMTPTTKRGIMRANQMTFSAVLLAGMVGLAGCDLDLTNPNAPTEEEVLTDIDGVIALTVGMQSQFNGTFTPTYIQAPSLVTDEWSTGDRALLADQSLVTGTVDRSFGVAAAPYNATYRVVRSANALLDNVNQVDLAPGFQAGIRALARLYKAMALGMAIQQYEEIPLDIGEEGAPLAPRSDVLATVLGLLDGARGELAGDPNLDVFRSRALGAGFDLRNTIDAMLARYHLMAGNHQEAIEAASRVDLDVRSEFRFPDPDQNPIFNYHFQLQYAAARASFVDEAEEEDQRPAYWVDVDAERFEGNPPGVALLPIRQYDTRNASLPVYLPGEVLLLSAEAHARLDDLDEARELINRVRTTDTGSGDPGLDPLGPDELATQDDLLSQIAYERRYELYMQGLRWEDMRRLGEYIDEEPSMMWLPVPQRECQANPNVTC